MLLLTKPQKQVAQLGRGRDINKRMTGVNSCRLGKGADLGLILKVLEILKSGAMDSHGECCLKAFVVAPSPLGQHSGHLHGARGEE